MRNSWCMWVGLLGLCIIGVALRCSDNNCRAEPPEMIGPPTADAPAPVKPGVPARGRHNQTTATNVVAVVNPPKTPAALVFETKADGYGVGEDDATSNAVETARDKIADFLASKYGETYRPTAELLTAKQIVGPPEFETANVPLTTDAAKTPMLKATVTVKLTGDQVKDFRESARKHRVHSRMKIAGLMLAGCVSLLLVGGGYLRLEEATKGYYTTLLRVAALGVLGVVAGALLMLWH